MTFSSLSGYARGVALTALGGIVLSIDASLLRLGQGDAWSVLAFRGTLTVLVALLIWLAVRLVSGRSIPLVPGWRAAWAGLFYGVSSSLFVAAVFNTATANVVFIIAFTPMFAALLSWIFLKERPGIATLVTMSIMIFGVGLIVQGGLTSGHVFGDLIATGAAFCIGAAITIGRSARRDIGFVPLIGAIIPAACAFIALYPQGIAIENPFWIFLDGAIVLPLAFWCLATGPRYLPASEVGMFYLLETILAPIWVWFVFSEVPSAQTLTGGAILIGALIGFSLWQMRAKSREAIAGCS